MKPLQKEFEQVQDMIEHLLLSWFKTNIFDKYPTLLSLSYDISSSETDGWFFGLATDQSEDEDEKTMTTFSAQETDANSTELAIERIMDKPFDSIDNFDIGTAYGSYLSILLGEDKRITIEREKDPQLLTLTIKDTTPWYDR